MYQALSEFLRTFSVEFPILWAIFITVVVAVTAFIMYVVWEAVLKGLSAVFTRNSFTRGDPHR